jgi:tetratricopeptide (TPR) repeat protein
MPNKRPAKKTPISAPTRKTNQKELSNPASTGGAGVSYEARVQSVYLLAMFTGAPTALLPEAAIVSLQFQGKIHNYETDDLICTLLDQVGKTRKALLQVKRTVKASASNKAFKETISAAWHDFKNPLLFTPDNDRLVLVYDADGESNMQGAIAIADFARTSLSGEEFLLKATAQKFSSPARRNAIGAIANFVVDVVGGPILLDELHRFVQHLWFISHHLSSEGTPEHADLLARIQIVLGRGLVPNPQAIWTELVNACLRLNPLAASISFANIDSQISSQIAAGFCAHRSSGASRLGLGHLLPVAALGISAPNQILIAAEQGGVIIPPASVAAASVARPAEAALPDSRPNSANKVISRQLDAINEKLKLCRYQEAQGDIVALGQDLGPFDTHQKARWYLQRGVCHWHLDQLGEAATDFFKAADLSDDDDKMAAAHIRGFLLREEIPEAIKAGEAALERFPDSLPVWIVVANARLVRGDSLTLVDVPPSHREDAGALQILAWARRLAGDWPLAIELSIKSLKVPSANFYTRHAALAVMVENATGNGILSTYRLSDAAAKDALREATDAFDSRLERLWSVQAPQTVAEVATHLGYAFLLLNDTDGALKVVQEAQAYGISSPALLRVELDALSQAQRTPELLEKGNAYVSQLAEDGLVSLAQAAANLGEIELVEKIIKAAESVLPTQPGARDVLMAIRWMALWSSPLRSKVTSEVLAASLSTSDSLPLILAGTRILLGLKEDAAAEAAITKAKYIVATADSPENVLLLAELLFEARKFEDASAHYERVLPHCQHSELHNRLLCSYIKIGNRRKAKKLIENFPAGWAENDGARSLAIELGQSAGDWPLLTILSEAQFQRAPQSSASWLFKFMVLVRSKPLAELQQFLSGMPPVLEGSIQQTAQLAGLELRYGLEVSGMRRMYRLRRSQMDDVESASALLLTYVGIQETLPCLEDALPSIAPGTSFVLLDQTGVRLTMTLDPAELPELSETSEFMRPDTDHSKSFFGIGVGGEVVVEGAYNTTRVFKVESITSAYRRLLDLAHQAIGQSLKPVSNAVLIPVPVSADGHDFTQVHAQLKRASAHAKHALDLYRTSPITLGAFSRLIAKHPIDVVRGWHSDNPQLFVCIGTTDEREAAYALLADPTAGYVIDAATLTEFASLDCLPALAALPKLLVSSMTRDIVQGKLREAKVECNSGQIFDDDGSLGFIETTPEDHRRDIQQLEKIVAAVADYCEVAPAYGPEVKNPLLDQLQHAISDEEHSVLLLAAERGAHLLTIDGRLRHWATAALLQGVWPQVALQHAVHKGIITSDTYSFATVRMFLQNRNFISLLPQDVLLMCQQGDSWMKYGMARYKKYISEPGTQFESVFNVTMDFLCYVAQSSTHVGAFAELLKHLVEGLLRHKDCPQDSMGRIAKFLIKLLRVEGFEYLYAPVAAIQEAALAKQFKYFRSALNEAAEWAQQAVQDRPLRVRVLMCGNIPLFSYCKDELSR